MLTLGPAGRRFPRSRNPYTTLVPHGRDTACWSTAGSANVIRTSMPSTSTA